MQRTSTTFSILQATAAVVAASLVLWSLGLTSVFTADAANVTSYSDTLSTSEPSVAANHEIVFTTPTGLTAGQNIVITFPAGFTGIGSLVAADLDFDNGGTDESLIDGAASGADWNVTAAGQTITITSGTDVMAANATGTILIGTNATGGSNQITNPGAGSYEIDISVGSGADTGSTRVAILSVVNVTASVDTVFNFTVAGVAGDTDVNGTDTTGGTTTATTIPFGTLEAGTASTAAQLLSVGTNAKNGFTVTVVADGQLDSITGADIDGYINGNYTTTPTAWTAPDGTVGSEETYGHWGLSSDDGSLTYAGGVNFVSASTSPVTVFSHDGPVNNAGQGQGTTTVIYKVETTALQEAAEDYTAVLTYIATPVF